MKNYDGFLKMNEASNELALLSNLYSFYLQKYGKEIAKEKFREQTSFLIEQGDLSKKSVAKFFKENNFLKTEVEEPKSYYSDSGCGSSQSVDCGSVPDVRPYDTWDYQGHSNNNCGSSSKNVGC